MYSGAESFLEILQKEMDQQKQANLGTVYRQQTQLIAKRSKVPTIRQLVDLQA